MMQLPQHHKPSKPSAPSCCSSWIRRSPPPSPPHKKPGGGGRSRYACRLVPLLVLTVYSVFTVLRIPSSSLVVTTADSGNPGGSRPESSQLSPQWIAGLLASPRPSSACAR
jgi:hypothetical protein